MANIIAGLGAQLGLDTTEFRKGISEAKNSLKDLKEYIPEILSVAAFVEMTRAAMEFSNKIVETAKANDVATASVLELAKALEENGGSADATSKIYSGFTSKLESAVQGNAKAQTSFEKLGVSLNDLRHLSEQDLFEKTVSALGNMKDSAERNGLAFETLGKSIRGVDLKGLAATMAESKGTMDKYANSIEQAHELSLKLEASSRNMSLQFTNAVIPTMNVLYDTVHKNSVLIDAFFKLLQASIEQAGRVIETFVTSLQHLWSITKLLAKDLYTLFDVRSYTQGTFFKQLTDNLNEFTTEWAKDTDDYVASMKKINDANEKVSTPKPQEKVDRTVVESYSGQLLAEKELFNAYKKRADLNLEILSQKEKDKTLTKNEKEMQDAINQVLNEQQRTLDEIDKKKNLIDKNKPGAAQMEAELDRQKTLVQVSTDYYVQQTQKVVAANQEARTKFSTGWNEAFAQYQDNAQTMADAGRKSFNTIVDSMSSALSNFVKTGKLNFGDLARTIIQNLITIQLQAQASKLFSMIPVMGGFGGGVGTTRSYTDFGGGSGELMSSADGGPLAAGQASIVGENGPEIIVPKGASTVIPNHLTGQVGGTTNVTNNYINAIDTKSFEDRLYGSSGAIWAANQYATKNIATTRSRT